VEKSNGIFQIFHTNRLGVFFSLWALHIFGGTRACIYQLFVVVVKSLEVQLGLGLINVCVLKMAFVLPTEQQ
jgi:hypothetical protein